MDYTNLPLFGAPLVHVETFVYYDGPQTFALRSIAWPEMYYVVNTVDEDDDSVTALIVRVAKHRFDAVRSGLVDFRETFSGAQDGSLWTVIWHFDDDGPDRPEIIATDANELRDDWLPVVGARLELPTKTAHEFSESELIRVSEAQGRTLFAVEVESATSRVTEFPAKNSGQLVLALNGSFESLSREHSARRTSSGVRGATRTSTAHREISPALVGVEAASFVFVFAVESESLVEPTSLVEETLDSLGALVAAAGEDEPTNMLEQLRTHSNRTRNRFKDLLAPLEIVGSGLAIASAVANSHEVKRFEADAAAVSRAIQAIESAPPSVSDRTVARGILMGLNVRTKRFELTDAASGDSYAGYMTDDAVAEANGLPVGDHSFIKAELRIELPFFAEEEGAAGEVVTLVSIQSIPSAT